MTDGEGKAGGQSCDVPGCGCNAGRGPGATPRLRPAFQDLREHARTHVQSHPGWTVLEDDSEDG